MAKQKTVQPNYAILFPPSGRRRMEEDFPELADEKEFRGLTRDEVVFAWYYGSFYANKKDNSEKINLCIKAAFIRADGIPSKTADEIIEYKKGNFPQNIYLAINKWKTFDLDARYRAKLIARKTLMHLEKFADYDEDEVDWGKRKQYTDTITSIIKELPGLIQLVESGFGVKEVKAGSSDLNLPLIDMWHNSQKGA